MTKLQQLEQHYLRSYEKLCRMLSRRPLYSPGDEEDIVQEAFSRATEYLDNYDQDLGNIREWFNRILNNCYNDYRERESNKGMRREVFDEEYHPNLDKGIEVDHKQVEKIESLISSKEEPIRSILDYYFLKDYSPSEINQMVDDIGYSNIRVIIHRFKQEMRGRL